MLHGENGSDKEKFYDISRVVTPTVPGQRSKLSPSLPKSHSSSKIRKKRSRKEGPERFVKQETREETMSFMRKEIVQTEQQLSPEQSARTIRSLQRVLFSDNTSIKKRDG